jgi:hypothetical protein
MPQENLFGPFQEAMRLAVSQGISERNLAASERDKASTLAVLREKMAADTAEKQTALAERKRVDQEKLLEKFINHAAETGNTELFQGLVGQLEKSSGVQWPRGPQPEQAAGMGPQTGIPPYMNLGPTVKQFAPASGQDDLTRALIAKLGPEGAAAALRPRANPQERFNLDAYLMAEAGGDVNEFTRMKQALMRPTAPKSPGQDPAAKDLVQLQHDIFKEFKNLDDANLGVGVASESLQPMRDKTIKTKGTRLNNLMTHYVSKGGDPARLGYPGFNAETAPAAPGATSAYKNPYDVKAAFKSGKLTKEEAAKILRDQFGAE